MDEHGIYASRTFPNGWVVDAFALTYGRARLGARLSSEHFCYEGVW
jgi:hypothetical protein